ncbi:MFS general substrate transporter [Jaminaea rosea]|uniref:MFS general substrate transporter n=1 Tax=Jaminaea rosea TaxID=1569628 RepID=A0A316UT43_9BASI|nr:MFS general substrate transporter [Jaminaea rosea]PWN28457.1 MFS general substrate transporter [Jaminaea rosea]
MPSERSPLLSATRDEDVSPTPLPRRQILVLCLIRISEPLAFLVIFPFIAFQLSDAMPNVPPERLGYYVGLVESAFAALQFIVATPYGRLSDRVGRKPIIFVSLAGTALAINLFGTARSFEGILLARCVNGIFGGSIGIVKTILGESTDGSNSARAFTLLPIMYSVGAIVGPFLGAQLSSPADKFPIFKDVTFLRKYPYWLPCGLVSLYVLVTMVIAAFFLEETLPSKVRKAEADEASRLREERGDEGQALLEADRLEEHVEEDQAKTPERPSIRSLLTRERVNILTTQMFLNFINISWSSLIPVFCFEQVRHGGVGLSKEGIGHLLAANGLISILVQTLLFPPLERKMNGPLKLYRVALLFNVPALLALPLAHYLSGAGAGREWAWTSLIAGTAFKSLAGMSIICATLLVTNSCPRGSLGTLNGISQSAGSFSRMLGPTLVTSLFAFGTSHKGLGSVVFIFLVSVAFATWALAQRITTNRRQD